jgi:hypothetical protein
MKNGKNIAVVAIIIAVIFLTTAYSAAQDIKVPTKKEVVALLKTAKEPADHLRIAAYYTQQAARLRGEAKEHSEMAAKYQQTHPVTAMESKQGYAREQSASHCKRFAQLALDGAKEADTLASLHKEMANTSAQKQ